MKKTLSRIELSELRRKMKSDIDVDCDKDMVVFKQEDKDVSNIINNLRNFGVHIELCNSTIEIDEKIVNVLERVKGRMWQEFQVVRSVVWYMHGVIIRCSHRLYQASIAHNNEFKIQYEMGEIDKEMYAMKLSWNEIFAFNYPTARSFTEFNPETKQILIWYEDSRLFHHTHKIFSLHGITLKNFNCVNEVDKKLRKYKGEIVKDYESHIKGNESIPHAKLKIEFLNKDFIDVIKRKKIQGYIKRLFLWIKGGI